MVCAPVRSIIPSLKLGDYLSVQAHNPCSISHLFICHLRRIYLFCVLTCVCFMFKKKIPAYSDFSPIYHWLEVSREVNISLALRA